MSYYRNAPPRAYGTGGGFGVPPVTPVIRGIMIACGSIWGVQFLLDPVLGQVNLAPIFGIETSRFVRGFLWQPFTYMWLHSPRDPFHLLFNLFALWMIGGDLERHWAPRRFLAYYLTCGIGAGLFILLAGWVTGVPGTTIGASGAVYGLILAYGMLFSERVILFMLIFPVRARTFAWILFGVTFVFTLGQSRSGVSHVAHLGGMVVGYLYVKRAWRVREFYRDLRWKLRRRRFKVMSPRDEDRWIH